MAATIDGMIQENKYDFNSLYNALTKKYGGFVNTSSYILAIDFLYILHRVSVNREGILYVPKRTKDYER